MSPSNFSAENHSLLNVIADALGELLDEVVFVGGITTFLLVENRGAARHTKDVDVIVNITTKREYYAFAEKLRNKGFSENVEDGVLCRWNYKDESGFEHKIDVMPVATHVLGFTNKWYKSAIETADTYRLSNGKKIKVINKGYFLGTKFEAFLDRGNGDYFSHDMEDIVFVIEHSPNIMLEIKDLRDQELKACISSAFKRLINDANFLSVLPGMLDDQSNINHVKHVLSFSYE